MGEEIPSKWIEFEASIERLAERGTNTMSLNQVSVPVSSSQMKCIAFCIEFLTGARSPV